MPRCANFVRASSITMDEHDITDDNNDDEKEELFDSARPRTSNVDLQTALQEAKAAVNLFFNNQFQDAWDVLKRRVGTSMYHNVGNSVFHFLQAVLTFERANIKKASDAIKNTMHLCNYYRRKNSFSDSIRQIVNRKDYENYSAEEIHAELCYAETLILSALITCIDDEKLIGFITAGLKIRLSFNSYKECQSILNIKQWTNEYYKADFESGVRMGMGAFNLVISLLPLKIIKLLQFIGISGSKEVGIDELQKCCNIHEGLRQTVSVLILLAYNLIVIFEMNHGHGDLQLCDEILNRQLKIYPNAAWFLYFKGRLEFMKGNIIESNHWYLQSWKSQSVWPHFHHLCSWEMMWTHAVILDWEEAQKYADILFKESRWSRTIYSYLKASFMLMRYDRLTEEEKNEVNHLMSNVPVYKQKIAGKSVPTEKFCIKKSIRYFSQSNHLVLPAIEIFFIWNLFKVIGKKCEYCVSVYQVIDQALQKLESDPSSGTYNADDCALVYLIKGCCLYQMKKLSLAEEAFKNVFSLEKKIKEDNYLVPYAHVQLAIIYQERGDFSKAIKILEQAKANYTGYLLESSLHFQIHSALLELKNNNSASSSTRASASINSSS